MWNLFLLANEHRRGRREHIKMEEDAMRRGGVAADVNVRTKSMFKRRSPAGKSLKDNTTPRILRIGKTGKLRLTWNKPYAASIDEGARRHDIPARRAPYLHFFWPKVGHWVKFKMVNHPGNRAYHFGFQAQKAAYHEMGQRLRFGMNRVSRIF